MAYVRIIATPPGEAPEDIRKAWIGLELPIMGNGTTNGLSSGVLTGPKARATQNLWMVLVITLFGLAVFIPSITKVQHGQSATQLLPITLIIVVVAAAQWYWIKRRLREGSLQQASGYAVNAVKALEVLRASRPDAAQWWQENCPSLFRFGGQMLLFDASVCSPVQVTDKAGL